jgi:hypothetical protein
MYVYLQHEGIVHYFVRQFLSFRQLFVLRKMFHYHCEFATKIYLMDPQEHVLRWAP